MNRISCLVLALAFAVLVGCGDSAEMQNVKKEVGETWDAVKAWGVAKRGEAEKFFSANVDSLSKAYDSAKAKAKAAGGDAEKSLEATWADVTQKWAELQAAGADKWDGARDAFVKAYESAKSQFTKGP